MSAMKEVRRQFAQGVKSARKAYYAEWEKIEESRRERMELQLAQEAQQRAVRIENRIKTHQVWLKEFNAREAVRKKHKQLKSAELWKKRAASVR